MSRWITPTRVLLFSTFLMEGLWVYLWLALLGNAGFLEWAETPLTPLSIVAVMWTSYYWVQIVAQIRERTARAGLWAGLSLLALLVILVRLENSGGYALWDIGWLRFASYNLVEALFTPMQITILGSMYLWWRGYRLAKDGMTQEQVFRSFIVGLIGTVVSLVLWEIAYRAGTLEGVGRGFAILVVAAFFFASLTALAMSHLMRVRREMMRQEGAGAFFSQPWIFQLLAFVTAMVVMGLIAASLFSESVLSPIVALIGLISNFLSLLLYYLAYPFVLAFMGIFFAIMWAVRKLAGGPPENFNLTIPDFSNLRRAILETERTSDVPTWVVLMKWAILIAIVMVVTYIFTRMVMARRGLPRPRDALEETHQSLGGLREFLRDVILGLVHLLWWFRDRRSALGHIPIVGRNSGWQVPQGELEVREMYTHLLVGASYAGFPRKAQETPNEYLHILEGKFPEEADALEEITRAYVAVRYGQVAPLPEQKGVLNGLWRGVYERLRMSAPPGKR